MDVLTTISKKLDNIGKSLHEVLVHQQKEEKRTESFQTIRTTIETIKSDMTEHMRRSHKVSTQQEASYQRQRIINEWRRNLNKRREAFWQTLNNENIAIIYDTWYTRENKILPKKLLIKEKAFAKFETEIKLLKARAEKSDSNLKAIECDMKDLLRTRYNDTLLEQLEEMWTEETRKEETKSAKRWEAKQR